MAQDFLTDNNICFGNAGLLGLILVRPHLKWRDAVWAHAYTQLEKVQNGERAIHCRLSE
jgi:hypothetical protein